MRTTIPIATWPLIPPALLLAVCLAIAVSGYVVLLVERGETVQLTAKLLAMAMRESTARALFIGLSPVGWGDGRPHPLQLGDEIRRDVPVLLVPHDRWNRSSLGFLRSFLLHRGWTWVWGVNLPKGSSLAEQAQQLVPRVERLLRESGASRIDLVGHGTGGLVAAWYAKHLAQPHRIRRLVTLGSPWRGTKMAVFRRGQLGRELLSGAPILDTLVPPPVTTVCVWSPDDPAVIPADNALPSDGVQSVRVDGAGHMEMLISARVFRAVQAALSQPVSQITEGS